MKVTIPAVPPLSPGSTSRLKIGHHILANPVLLAPMTGVSDLPFRQLTARLGAGLVVSEMVASRELVNERPDVVRRSAGDGARAAASCDNDGCDAHGGSLGNTNAGAMP